MEIYKNYIMNSHFWYIERKDMNRCSLRQLFPFGLIHVPTRETKKRIKVSREAVVETEEGVKYKKEYNKKEISTQIKMKLK